MNNDKPDSKWEFECYKTSSATYAGGFL